MRKIIQTHVIFSIDINSFNTLVLFETQPLLVYTNNMTTITFVIVKPTVM